MAISTEGKSRICFVRRKVGNKMSLLNLTNLFRRTNKTGGVRLCKSIDVLLVFFCGKEGEGEREKT